jgi:carbonic anhydrase
MPADVSPDQALERLLEGNTRWVDERQAHPNRSADRRRELAAGQAPFATVFSCLDSRVPPEIVFDCGTGELAVVRTGGHVLDEEVVMGSLRFCAELLKTPLMLVMGHESCGAVGAAIAAIEGRQTAPPGLGAIVDAIRPAYDVAKNPGEAQDLAGSVVCAHTLLTVRRIAEADWIASLMRSGELRVVGAHYSLATGKVSLLD